jgi:hypothetical protein
MASAVIGALRVNLGIDTAAFSAGLSNAQGKLATFGKSAAPAVTAVAALGAAAGMAGAALVGALVKNSLDSIDTQSKLAAKLGATVVGVQALDQAANLAGISSEDMAKSMGVLNARLGEAARSGSGSTYEAFKRLGLSIQELSAMDADQRLAAIADQMQALGYTTQQQADFLKQVGIRSQDMITVMQGGGDAIRSARKDVEDFGLAVSDIDAKKIEAANDAITQIGVVAAGVGNQIAIRLAPYIEAMATGLTDAARESGGFGEVISTAISVGVRVFARMNEEIYRSRVDFDGLVGAILNGFDAIAGAAPKGIAALFGGTAEDYGFKPINESWGRLKETLEKPPSTEEWEAWMQDINAKAASAAEAALAATTPGGGDGGDDNGPTEAETKAAEKYQEQLSAKLEQLQYSLLTEREAELASYAERMTDLQDFLASGLVTKQEYAEMALAVEADHVEKVKQLDRDAADEAKRAAATRFNAISSLADSASSIIGTLFEGSKAAAIAQTVINTGQAIMATLASVPAPWGYAVAAGVAATGAAQIAMMSRTNRNSSGGSGASAKAAAPSAPSGGDTQPSSSSTLFVQGISSAQLFSGDAVRDLAQKLIDYQADGGKVVLA